MIGFQKAPDDLSKITTHKSYWTTEEQEYREPVKDIVGIKVLLMPEIGELQKLWIPISIEGKIQFDNVEKFEFLKQIYFWGETGKWFLCCCRPTYFLDRKGQSCHKIEINNSNVVEVRNLNPNCKIYMEMVSDNHRIFKNYQIYPGSEIIIGKSVFENSILYSNNMISLKHSVLYWKNTSLHIKDCDSSTGTWVNDKRISDIVLKLGDIVYILGLVIIIGVDFISINSEQTRVNIKSENIRELNQDLLLRQMMDEKQREYKLFNRLPRRILGLEEKKIEIEAPPMSLNDNAIPLMLRMGGSIVMGGASAISGNYLMLLTSVLFPLLTQKYSDKEKKEYEIKRLEKYREYLENKKEEILKEKEYEEEILCKNYPELNKILEYPIDGKQLWERRKTDEDFLNIRIGYGDSPIKATIQYPKQRFNMETDILEEEMVSLAKTSVKLENVPIMANLIQNFVCSVSGEKSLSYAFLKRIIMMIAVLHSYDEVKMIFLAEKEDLNGELEFVKYLPHTWDDQKNMRYVATTPGEAYQIGESIKGQIEKDFTESKQLKDILKEQVYYVVFGLNKKIFDSMEILKLVMQQEQSCGISIITVFDDLPKECTLLFHVDTSGRNSISYLKEISRKEDMFKMDRFEKILSQTSMKHVANTNLKNITQAYSLPKALTFLEMYQVGKVEHLNVTKRWQENDPVKSLSAPIGVSTDGSLFYLDLHQKYQGPHGLVAGTTGSGKSELLITYILSMAINYHPDEVAFVLIDYKGGGLAGAFEDPVKGIHLPHLVGTITNLDGAAIQRSLMSIQSELKRRQRVFNEARSVSDAGTMDIYLYQKLYRNKIVSDPMPHLFIISDEFAELKQQQPEFMDQLISAARIGRSLGVHLILATQKPAGVVNDQIRSNTKFRICLKVQDRMDSQDMLERPEAAELQETGRFYLQVGYNEFFALGQSGWSGASYEPQDEVQVQRDGSIKIIDSIGQTLVESKPVTKRSAEQGTQLVAIVKMLSAIAQNQDIAVRKLWKPALKRRLDITDIEEKEYFINGINCPLGMLDDPENQEQYTLVYHFEEGQHLMIAGETGSGKTLLIQNILYSLVKNYTPEDINFYILDYSSRMLKNFSKLPHCGNVLLEDDEDKLDALFEIIKKIITSRKKLFSEIGADNFITAKKIIKIPLILVFIDNIAGLNATRKGESYIYELNEYLKNGLNYGVKYVISCNHLNEMPMRLRQEMGDYICLHMKDKYEYTEVLNCKVSYIPPEMPGRGMYNRDGHPLEFQAAIYHAKSEDKNRIEELKQEVLVLKKQYAGYTPAKRIPVITQDATYEEFIEQFEKGRIPLGYAGNTQKPVALPLKQFSLLSVYQGNEDGEIPILNNFLLVASKEKMRVWCILKNKNSHLAEMEFDEKAGFEINSRKIKLEQQESSKLWHELSEEILTRQELRDTYRKQQDIREEKVWEYLYRETVPLLLVIESYAEFCQTLDSISIMVYDKLFQNLNGLNIYILAFFYPDDPEEIKEQYIYSGFNEENILLFGGRLDKQSLVKFSQESQEKGKSYPFNTCLMKYRSSYHVLTMPCGEIQQEVPDPDSQDIFI